MPARRIDEPVEDLRERDGRHPSGIGGPVANFNRPSTAPQFHDPAINPQSAIRNPQSDSERWWLRRGALALLDFRLERRRLRQIDEVGRL